MKNEKAITLLALVITIVVLIILATVAINLSIGNSEIFNRAKIAKQEYANAVMKEENDITKATDDIEGYINGDRTMPDWTYLGTVEGGRLNFKQLYRY